MTIRLPPSPFLYPILDMMFSADPIADARKLIRAGSKILQFRAKEAPKRKIYDITVELASICEENQVCLIINDVVDIVLVTKASGVHLGQEDLPVAEARKLLGTRIIGLSTHNAGQFTVAHKSAIDYIAIGPVYKTSTKQGLSTVLGLSNVIPLLIQKTKPVIAIGGIRSENFSELISAGIDGIALISELHRNGDVYETACRLLDKIRKHEKI